MFKDVLQHMDLALLTRSGLVIFFACFVAIVLWAVSRSRSDVRRWAELPLSASEAETSEETAR